MENIINYSYEDEMKDSFRDYALSVIVSRALPDVKDGLKPVQRRVLYAMRDLGVLPNTPYKKSARIVGEVIGKYHPHGDSAVYETMVRLSQDFRMMAPLVDGHGNFGSIDGDGAAAMRYTEARLSPVSMKLLEDLEKNVVNFRENYDGTEREPELLPTKFPQLLINGYKGIAVGMKGSVPPHNVDEVMNAFLAYTKLNNPTLDSLLPYLSAPDYPTGGTIINAEELKEFYRTGEGRVIIRSKIDIEEASYGKKNIVVTEIPYTISGNKGKLVDDITKMVVDKKLNELTDVRDESSKDGIRIVLEVKKGINMERLLQKLYSRTKLQDTDNYQFLALVDGKPTTLSLIEYFHHYLEFQKEINRRKHQYLLEKGLGRKEILDGLIKAVDYIDPIVDAIRGSKTVKQMMDCLTKGKVEGISFKLKKHEKTASTFTFTENQARAILEMKLQRLGALEVDKLKKEHEQLMKDIAFYEKILKDPKALLQLIRKEHRAFQKEFNSPRMTEIQDLKTTKYVEQKIVEPLTVLVDRYGYAKTMDEHLTKEKQETIKKDYSSILLTDTDGRLMVFTNKGNLYQIKTNAIPKGKWKDKGITIQSIAGFDRGEHIVYITDKKHLQEATFLFVNTSGLAKRVEGKRLISNRSKVLATKLDDNDTLLFVQGVEGKEELILQTKQGYVLKTKSMDFSIMGKTAKGVQGITLEKEDAIDRAYLLSSKEPITLLVNGKKIQSDRLVTHRRAAKGKRV